MRDQVVARYGDSSVLSEKDIMNILEDLWEEMDPIDKQKYFDNEDLPLSDDSALSHTSSDSSVQAEAEIGNETEVESTEDESDARRDRKKTLQSESTILTRSRTAGNETFLVAKDKTKALVPSRVGCEYQAQLPEFGTVDDVTQDSGDHLISTPSNFNMEGCQDFLKGAVKRAHMAIMSFLTEREEYSAFNGTFVTVNSSIELLAMEALNDR
jgi:hypothetical protein